MTSTTPSAGSSALAACREEGRAALIGYLPVGFPTLAGSLEAIAAIVEGGVDIVEVGVPYSDPLMDGPVIQRATETALAAGMTVDDVFTAVAASVAAGAPAYVMSYWNLILRRGVDRFAADLAAAGGSGVITPDLIPDEASEWLEAARRHDLDPVFLVAPSSTTERLSVATAARLCGPRRLESSASGGGRAIRRRRHRRVSPRARARRRRAQRCGSPGS